MKNVTLLLICIISLFSCQSDNTLKGKISKMEQIVEANGSKEQVAQLNNLYQQYITENPNDEEWNGRYLYRSGASYLRIFNYGAAVKQLKKGILDCGQSSATPNSLLLLGNTYKKRFKGQEATANLYYQALIEGFPNHEYVKEAKANQTESLSLDTLITRKFMTLGTNTLANRTEAKQLLELYKLYTKILPKAKNTPKYLYQTHNVAIAIQKPEEAIRACEELFTRFPNHEKAPNAMFLAAFNYQNYVKDLTKAEELYKKFIATYPNDEFVKDAKISLENLGLSAEEMLKKIQNQK